MPLALADIGKNAVRLRLTWADEEFYIFYRPAQLTREYMEALQAVGERAQALGAETPDDDPEANAVLDETAALFCQLVSDWDVLEEAGGAKMPVTPERIRTLLTQPGGADFCGYILYACAEQQRLGERRGTVSSPTSASTSRRAARSTGSRKRRSPTGSKRSS